MFSYVYVKKSPQRRWGLTKLIYVYILYSHNHSFECPPNKYPFAVQQQQQQVIIWLTFNNIKIYSTTKIDYFLNQRILFEA